MAVCKWMHANKPVTSVSSPSSLSWNEYSWYNVFAERRSFLWVERSDIECVITGLIAGLDSTCGDVAWLGCFNVSVSADWSAPCTLSNSFCSDGGPEPTANCHNHWFNTEPKDIRWSAGESLTWTSITTVHTAYRVHVHHWRCIELLKAKRNRPGRTIHRMQPRSIQFYAFRWRWIELRMRWAHHQFRALHIVDVRLEQLRIAFMQFGILFFQIVFAFF